MTTSQDQLNALDPYLAATFSRKPEAVTALDISNLSSYADTVLIITARSSRQVISLAEHLYTTMKQQGTPPLGNEGIKSGTWALLDFGDVIIHIFNPETKAFYDLEGLWRDAPVISLAKAIGTKKREDVHGGE